MGLDNPAVFLWGQVVLSHYRAAGHYMYAGALCLCLGKERQGLVRNTAQGSFNDVILPRFSFKTIYAISGFRFRLAFLALLMTAFGIQLAFAWEILSRQAWFCTHDYNHHCFDHYPWCCVPTPNMVYFLPHGNHGTLYNEMEVTGVRR